MSLYNMLFGVNNKAPLLLAVLDLAPATIPRFRDAYIQEEFIVIHTRTGGGNREGYVEENAALQQHPLYSHDQDDDFDSTYADFFFRFPEDLVVELRGLRDDNPDVKPSDKWKALLQTLESK